MTASGSGSVDLPTDLLKDKRVERIYLGCQVNASPKLGLTIAPSTFEFTRFNTTVFGILNCDLAGQTDMQYLNDFLILNTLRIDDCDKMEAIESLPTSTLPALKEMIVVNCTGLENVTFPDLTPAQIGAVAIGRQRVDRCGRQQHFSFRCQFLVVQFIAEIGFVE